MFDCSPVGFDELMPERRQIYGTWELFGVVSYSSCLVDTTNGSFSRSTGTFTALGSGNYRFGYGGSIMVPAGAIGTTISSNLEVNGRTVMEKGTFVNIAPIIDVQHPNVIVSLNAGDTVRTTFSWGSTSGGNLEHIEMCNQYKNNSCFMQWGGLTGYRVAHFTGEKL